MEAANLVCLRYNQNNAPWQPNWTRNTWHGSFSLKTDSSHWSGVWPFFLLSNKNPKVYERLTKTKPHAHMKENPRPVFYSHRWRNKRKWKGTEGKVHDARWDWHSIMKHLISAAKMAHIDFSYFSFSLCAFIETWNRVSILLLWKPRFLEGDVGEGKE